MIDAICEIVLVSPYATSISTLFDMGNIWGFSVISSDTNSDKAIVSIPYKTFKKIFKSNPEKNKEYAHPTGSDKFIVKARVLDVKIIGENK